MLHCFDAALTQQFAVHLLAGITSVSHHIVAKTTQPDASLWLGENKITCRRLSHVCSNCFVWFGLRGSVQGFAQTTYQCGQRSHCTTALEPNIPRLLCTPRNISHIRWGNIVRDWSLDIIIQPSSSTMATAVSWVPASDVLQFQRGIPVATPKPGLWSRIWGLWFVVWVQAWRRHQSFWSRSRRRIWARRSRGGWRRCDLWCKVRVRSTCCGDSQVEEEWSSHVAAVMTMRRAKWFLMSFPMLRLCRPTTVRMKLWYVDGIFATGWVVTQGSKPTWFRFSAIQVTKDQSFAYYQATLLLGWRAGGVGCEYGERVLVITRRGKSKRCRWYWAGVA